MKNSFLLSLLLAVCAFSFGQEGYKINISLKPFKNEYIYLGYYYGKIKALADSALLNGNSEGVFEGKEKLPGGIYFVVSPKKEILFEVLIDKKQQFSIAADTASIGALVFSGSEENSQFQYYSRFAGITGRQITKLNESYKTTKDPATRAQLKTLNDQLTNYRDSVTKKDKTSLLATLFNAMREPQVPPASAHPGGKYDSLYAFRYYKAHYWDGVSFSDDRLVRTPFFEPRLERYYKDLVAPEADSIKKEIDAMLLEARTSKEMFKFLLVHFVQKYINPEYMGQDAVFVHLFEKYINTGQATFFTTQYRDFVDKRAYSLMANLIGKQAANLQMVDSTGKKVNLYDVAAPYTVVVFWDPTCGHCKEVVPKVDSIYDAKWKKAGVKLFAVKTDGPKDEWSKFIREHSLDGWIHVYELPSQQEADNAAGRPSYRQLYDVYQTPVLYLLDNEKRIVAKKLTYLQIDDVLELKKKNPR